MVMTIAKITVNATKITKLIPKIVRRILEAPIYSKQNNTISITLAIRIIFFSLFLSEKNIFTGRKRNKPIINIPKKPPINSVNELVGINSL
jgi:hypothetical protein